MCKYGEPAPQPGGRASGLASAGLETHRSALCSDPDNVAFCVLAADEEDEGDIALQIHFTLIQAFCCENAIDIVRVNDVGKLAAIVGPSEDSGEPRDLHCILITVGVPRRAGRCSVRCGRGCCVRGSCRPLYGRAEPLRRGPHLLLAVRLSSGQRKRAWHTPHRKSAE